MDFRDVQLIPKGQCAPALGATRGEVDRLEQQGILRFRKTVTGRKYTNVSCLEDAREWLAQQSAA